MLRPPHEQPSTGVQPESGDAWSTEVPDHVRRAYLSNAGDGWAAWSVYLTSRKRPRRLGNLLPGKRSPLAWELEELPNFAHAKPTIKLLHRLVRLGKLQKSDGAELRSHSEAWLGVAPPAEQSAPYALASLAWCSALPELAQAFEADHWWRLVEYLLMLVSDAPGVEPDCQPVAWQLLGAELPISMAYMLPELAATPSLSRVGREVLSRGIADLLDGEGLIHAKHVSLARPLAASWTRTLAMLDEVGIALDKRTLEEYRHFFHNELRLMRADGSQTLNPRTKLSGGRRSPLWKAARRLARDRDCDLIADAAQRDRGKLARAAKTGQPAPANHSPWAAMAILRSRWSPASPQLTLAYHQADVRVELAVGGDVLFSGTWGLELRQGGVPVTLNDRWEEICWVSDDDMDYCEIEARFTGNLRVQRQCMLARKDGILFLADAIVGPEPSRIEYTGVLPITGHSVFAAAAETAEGILSGYKSQVSVLPIGLSEWRSDARRGRLTPTERGLELHQQSHGAALFAPFFFDLRKKRIGRQLTWRHLTVAEERKLLPADVAVGYRVQIGKAQWLIYRSLATPGTRSVLGQNLSTEFLAARFRRDGDIDTLVEIEPA